MNEENPDSIRIPYDELTAQALRGVIESFVLREGTDYGSHEYSLEQKVDHVLRQLTRGDAHIVFNPTTESVDIVVTKALRVGLPTQGR